MKRKLLVSTLMQACSTLGMQLVAMTSLPSRDFGAFSLVYLAAALGLSITLSVLLDPWLLSRGTGGGRRLRREFDAVLSWLALASALVAGAVAFALTQHPVVGLLAAGAAAAGLQRSGHRYRCMADRQLSPVLWGDAFSLLAVVGGAVAAAALGGLDLLGVFVLWCGAAVASAVAHPLPASVAPRAAASFLRSRWHRIKGFLADSLLMDLGAIGTPYVIGGFAGLSALGIYRGVSNVAAPVRLVLNPLRPLIVQTRMTTPLWALVALGSFVFGAGAWVALQLIAAMSLQLGTLSELTPHAAPTAIFVAANFMGHTAYMVARGAVSGRSLMLGRVVQTILAIALPIGGALTAGIPGAAWGLAVATACSATCWTWIAVRGRSTGGAQAAGRH